MLGKLHQSISRHTTLCCTVIQSWHTQWHSCLMPPHIFFWQCKSALVSSLYAHCTFPVFCVQAQLIAQSIGQSFSVAYQEFLRANGINPEDLSQKEYSDIINTQEMYNDDLIHFSNSENCKEVGPCAAETFCSCLSFSWHWHTNKGFTCVAQQQSCCRAIMETRTACGLPEPAPQSTWSSPSTHKE